MKKIYALCLTLCAMLVAHSVEAQIACNWKSNFPNVRFWDSCNVNTQNYALNGYGSFNSSRAKCFKYSWSVNGAIVGTGNSFKYKIKSNGQYNVCLKVTDTCANCDTTFCSTRNITCVPSSGCNWKSRYPTALFWDSCNVTTKKFALNGYISFNSNLYQCFKYSWTVNGAVVKTGNSLAYNVTQNGTYNVCVRVLDTCNNCDTVFCSSRTISCIPGSGCNWAGRFPTARFWDSCGSNVKTTALNGYISFNWNNYTCLKYTWKVNGNVVGTGNNINYPISTNGSYTISVGVKDTCNNCDTVFSATRNITCIPGSNSGCNWKSRMVTAQCWDSCNVTLQQYHLYGYVGSNYMNSCWKINWTVNGVNAGTGNSLKFKIIQNGTYNVCAKVVDTCAKCDTIFCSSRSISCIPTSNTGCNWKANNSAVYMKDSCDIFNKKYKLMGYFANSSGAKSCFKYRWMVNGALAGDGMIFNYSISKNGMYQVCVNVKDTCNNCDTTICQSYQVSCIPNFNGGCNWKALSPKFITHDTCYAAINKNALKGYITFLNASTSCFKYTWMVNGLIVSRDYYLNRNVSTNGSYRICVKVTDTCSGCDTTFCETRNINCLSVNHGNCNWKSRNPALKFWDSCNLVKNIYMLNGSCYFNSNLAACYKFTWAINGIIIGTGNQVNFPVTMNGNYELCVKVTDTCNKCDTVYCSVRQINCIPPTVGIGSVDKQNIAPEVYPNPANGLIYIRHELKSGSYIMFDMAGKMVRNGKLNDAVQSLDLSGLPDGCYLIRCESEAGIFHNKVMIQSGN